MRLKQIWTKDDRSILFIIEQAGSRFTYARRCVHIDDWGCPTRSDVKRLFQHFDAKLRPLDSEKLCLKSRKVIGGVSVPG
jgi:hypothetical protein